MAKGNKKYCPLFTIAWDPPKDPKSYDPRTCKSDCAWFDDTEKQCAIVSIQSVLEAMMTGYGTY